MPETSQDSALVRDAFAGLARALKRVSIYRHAPGQHASFVEPVLATFREVLSRRPAVTISVEQGSLTFEGQPVYTEPPREWGLCFRLHRDGIRTITFKSGLSAEELLDFMDVALPDSQGGPATSREDAVTELWKADLASIEYTAIAGYRIEEHGGPGFSQAVEALIERVQEMTQASGSDALTDHGAPPLLWDDALRKKNDSQSWGELARRAALTVLRIVERDLAGWDLEALQETFWRLVDDGAERGEVLAVVAALDGARRLQGQHAAGFRTALSRKMMDEKRLARAVELVGLSDKGAAQILASWLQLLPAEAGPNIASALATATRGDVIAPLAHAALVRLGTSRAFVEEILHRGPAAVSLGILAQLGAVQAVRPRAELAAAALGHPETRVRAEAMRIVPIEPQVAVERLRPLLEDADPQLRMTAADALSSCISVAEPAALLLIRAMSRPDFEQREREELVVFHRALGRLQSTTGHSYLAERLAHPKKGFLKKRRNEQEQLLAVQGLAEEATLRSLRILEDAMVPGRGHPPSVVNACRAAALRIRTPRGARGGGNQ
ncbi:MAG: hypothetical protein E6J62_18390 [Deltaproteobacteria bacterium]|nr:MAG: hypothetical protein E6J62_18390 [Deltaproteobacteria bacterium]